MLCRDTSISEALLDGLQRRAVVIADKGCDADRVRICIRDQQAIPNIPNRCNRKKKYRWKKAVYRERNQFERFFNKLKTLSRRDFPRACLRLHPGDRRSRWVVCPECAKLGCDQIPNTDELLC